MRSRNVVETSQVSSEDFDSVPDAISVSSLDDLVQAQARVTDDVMTPCDACEFCNDCCSSPHCDACKIKAMRSLCPNGEQFYTPCQIRRHNTVKSAWLVAGDTVYDATAYITSHPGGTESILKRAGGVKDVTRDLNFHSASGQRLFQKCKLGRVRVCRCNSSNDARSKSPRPFWALW
jgi:cytochrome b involved in lipid metabolism